MKTLKKNIDLSSFLTKVTSCDGEVLLHTDEGDILNAKSMLSRFVLAAAYFDPMQNISFTVECAIPRDYLLLSVFLQ